MRKRWSSLVVGQVRRRSLRELLQHGLEVRSSMMPEISFRLLSPRGLQPCQQAYRFVRDTPHPAVPGTRRPGAAGLPAFVCRFPRRSYTRPRPPIHRDSAGTCPRAHPSCGPDRPPTESAVMWPGHRGRLRQGSASRTTAPTRRPAASPLAADEHVPRPLHSSQRPGAAETTPLAVGLPGCTGPLRPPVGRAAHPCTTCPCRWAELYTTRRK